MKEFRIFNSEEYRKRLRILRKVMNMNQVEFARFLEMPFKRWNHYERGYPIPRETAWELIEKIPGICPVWIWFGWDGNLSVDMRERINKAQKEEAKLGFAKSGEQETTRIVISHRKISSVDKTPKRKKKAATSRTPARASRASSHGSQSKP
ncbi:transcriptional regulator with XRE-family HTH domain [Bradyrhizobium sp. S3.9.2]|uniref:helix-turn-helix domain-containing protein n=1 Tax=Bradyrhizobium sp. S3.9.2 TaxID=3156432 RepID=UPI00339A88B4